MAAMFDDSAYVTVVADLKRQLDRLRAELKVPVHPPQEAYGVLFGRRGDRGVGRVLIEPFLEVLNEGF